MGTVHHERVEALRALMRERGWDVVIVSGSDPHSSEYPAPRWKQVEWLSGFTGEAGDIVVTASHAGLWTDTRYFIQAVRQLEGSGIVLHKTRVPEQVLIPEWLAGDAFADCERSIVIAVDGLCQGVSAVAGLKDAFLAAGRTEGSPDEDGFRIVSVPDMLEDLWEDRPPVPQTPIITLGAELAGEDRWSRIGWLRDEAAKAGCDAVLLTALDEIAWTLNVRGADIEYNPLVISYLLVTGDSVEWFVRKGGQPDGDTLDSFQELRDEGVSVLPYDDVSVVLAGEIEDGTIGQLAIDPSTLNYNLYHILKTNSIEGTVVEWDSPVALRKAVKNATEIQGMRDIHVEDGLAMERFLYWLEKSVKGGSKVDEWDAARKLGALRAEIPGYRGDSFETISAYGEGAALPHYITPHRGASVLEPRGLYLVDSGGQYMNGTTDITRTVPLGPCTMLEKEDYTLVLKGHIDLAMAVFPRGTAGCQIDALARSPLWRARRSFGHGTGHGVGFFLGVHEGPQDIRQNFNRTPILPGMITSNEPGIYREGMHGVRHENLVLCVEDGRNEFGDWLRFETLTLCHFDTSAIIVDLLGRDEIEWLNAYNARVFSTLSPMLSPEEAEWLHDKCKPI
ncbi:MAG: aminopeptidase P family protein [Bacteroidales bacterium]|nr:aminopeptidase P family protein [Bacteroidales bacterium]